MKRIPLLFLALSAATVPLRAQQAPIASPGENDVASSWPGVHYEVTQIYRLPIDRLLIVLRVYATAQASPGGVQIGIIPPRPADTPENEALTSKYFPRPFSFESAVLTDEQTHQEFKTVAPLPTERPYPPGELVGVLHRGEGMRITLQFPVPPPPPQVDGTTPKQTFSLLFPKADKPITDLAVPPPPGSYPPLMLFRESIFPAQA